MHQQYFHDIYNMKNKKLELTAWNLIPIAAYQMCQDTGLYFQRLSRSELAISHADDVWKNVKDWFNKQNETSL